MGQADKRLMVVSEVLDIFKVPKKSSTHSMSYHVLAIVLALWLFVPFCPQALFPS